MHDGAPLNKAKVDQPPTPLGSLFSKIEGLNNMLIEAEASLSQKLDQLCGKDRRDGQAQAGKAGGPSPVPDGMLERLSDEIDDARNWVERIHSQLQRLHDIGLRP